MVAEGTEGTEGTEGSGPLRAPPTWRRQGPPDPQRPAPRVQLLPSSPQDSDGTGEGASGSRAPILV